MHRRGFLFSASAATAAGLLVAGCGHDDQAASGGEAGLSVEDPWVRTTDGARDTSMSAAFMTIVNPTNRTVNLVRASTPVAGMTQLHEMAMSDGKKVMREVKQVSVPAGGHRHLVSGGNHIMLMKLKRTLPIGDQVDVELEFDTGQKLTVNCMVKEFTEEEDHYHETPGQHTPGASPSR